MPVNGVTELVSHIACALDFPVWLVDNDSGDGVRHVTAPGADDSYFSLFSGEESYALVVPIAYVVSQLSLRQGNRGASG